MLTKLYSRFSFVDDFTPVKYSYPGEYYEPKQVEYIEPKLVESYKPKLVDFVKPKPRRGLRDPYDPR